MPEQTKVRIGLGAPGEPNDFAEKLAQEWGFYQKHGLTAELTGFEGDTAALQALIAGQLDFIVTGVPTVLTTELTDTPTKIIALNALRVSDALYCTKDIKTAADVKGKQIAVGSLGGDSHGSVLLALKALGLTPKDVIITVVGGQSSRIAALKGGSMGCAPADAGLAADLEALGLNMLVNLQKSDQLWGGGALVARDDYLAKNPNTALAVVASALEAQNKVWTDPSDAAAKFASYAQLDPADATKAVNDFPLTGNRTLMWTDQALQGQKETLATVNPAIANVDLSTASDRSFVEKLKTIGFYQQVGVPLP